MPSQSEFATALLDPAQPVPHGVAGEVERFDIYRNNVVVSLTTALARIFPVTVQMLGEDYFRALAAEFVRRHPPADRMVALYGAAFPGFVAGFEPLKDYFYLPDLALLEWTRLVVWHSAERPLIAADLAEDLEKLLASQLTLQPAAQILISEWPVASLWEAHKSDDFVSPEVWDGEALAIFRREARLIHAPMPPHFARFLLQLEHSPSLGDALVQFVEEDIAADALRLTINLLRAGCLVPTTNNYW